MGDWNAKVGSKETAGVTGKFGLETQHFYGQTHCISDITSAIYDITSSVYGTLFIVSMISLPLYL